MEIVYYLIPLMVLVGFGMVLVLFWAIRSGQYEDLEGPASQILYDEDDPLLPKDYGEKENDTNLK